MHRDFRQTIREFQVASHALMKATNIVLAGEIDQYERGRVLRGSCRRQLPVAIVVGHAGLDLAAGVSWFMVRYSMEMRPEGPVVIFGGGKYSYWPPCPR